eukprot:5363839-Pyramimonas_sp.AAC.1
MKLRVDTVDPDAQEGFEEINMGLGQIQTAPRKRRAEWGNTRNTRRQQRTQGEHTRTTASARRTGSGWNVRGMGEDRRRAIISPRGPGGA